MASNVVDNRISTFVLDNDDVGVAFKKKTYLKMSSAEVVCCK